MSRSWALEAVAYGRERFAPGLTLFVGALLGTASLAGSGGAPPLFDVLERCALALALFVEFRIWDDLADVARDRREHPMRVMVRAASLWPFVRLLLLVTAAAVALFLAERPSLGGVTLFGLMHGAGALWYATRRLVRDEAARAQFLLAKYPAIVFCLGSSRAQGGVRLLVAAALVYACFAVYEFGHDARVASQRWARVLLPANLALGAAAVTLGLSGVPCLDANLAIAVATWAVLALIVRRQLLKEGFGRLPHALFALALLQSLATLLYA